MEWAVVIAVGLGIAAFFAAGCACCGCAIVQDDFTRSNGTDIGDDWTEESGDWSISVNRLATSASNAIAVHDTVITESRYVVQVSVGTSTGNPSVNVFVRQDSNNYLVGKYHYNPATFDTTLSLVECVSGVETVLKTVPASGSSGFGGFPALRLYVDTDNGVVVFCQAAQLLDDNPVIDPAEEIAAVICRTAPSGGQIAVGTGSLASGVTVYFDSFRVHPQSSSCGDQVHCCTTLGQYPPEEIQVEIEDLQGYPGWCQDCDDLNGTYTLTLLGAMGPSDFTNACAWAVPIDIACGVNWLVVHESFHPTARRLVVELRDTTGPWPWSYATYKTMFENTDNKRLCSGDAITASIIGWPTNENFEICGRNFGLPLRTGTCTVTPL